MKTLLYTGHDAAYKPLADITVPRMAAYAEKHRIDFKCYTEPLVDVPNGIYWTGVAGGLNAFNEGYERAIYLDVDQLITNPRKAIFKFKGAVNCPRDWGYDATLDTDISACCIVSHKDAKAVLEETLAMEPKWRDKPFPEQGPLRVVMKKYWESPHDPFGPSAFVWGRKPMNSVPDAVCPGNVPEPWKPGDVMAHITMLPLEQRVDLAKKLIKEHGL